MKILVNFFPEIILKSKSVRKQFTNRLQSNIRTALKPIVKGIHVENHWERIIISIEKISDDEKTQILEKLACIPGIDYFCELLEFGFTNFKDISDKAFELYKNALPNKSLCVRVKRSSSNRFRALDAEREIGGNIIEQSPSTTVNLTKPDVLIRIRTQVDTFSIEKERIRGIGGFPVGSAEKALSLISGGFDSGVSSFLMTKKGAKLDYLFFNLGGRTHQIGVKEVTKYITTKFSDGYSTNFVSIDFEPIVAELLEKIHHKYRGVILKRLMMMVASKIANEHQYAGIVTGESTGQVSSQTLTNLNVITKASDTLVLRPLLTMDKIDIIDIARKIGTEDFAKNMPEFCAVISDKPSTAAKLEDILKEEENFDFSLLDKALETREIIKIKNYEPNEEEMDGVEQCSFAHKHEIIIDVREDEKRESHPIQYEGASIIEIPFFKINRSFESLDQSKTYLLYCDQGVMSKMVALNLKELGFSNIKVLRPLEKGCELKNS